VLSTCPSLLHRLAEAARVKALGGEGLMLRKAAALHRGGRNTDLLKVKEFQDDEAIVTGHEEGAGRLAGLLGALVCRARNGMVFKVGSGFTDEQRSFAKAPKVGSVITYKFFEVGGFREGGGGGGVAVVVTTAERRHRRLGCFTVSTFRRLQLTDDLVPRFPTFLRVRPDVDPSEFAAVGKM
jgi:hypothetical protein